MYGFATTGFSEAHRFSRYGGSSTSSDSIAPPVVDLFLLQADGFSILQADGSKIIILDTAPPQDFLLQEDFTLIEQEDGSKILIE